MNNVQKESIAAPSHLPSKGRDPTGRELQIKKAHRPGKNQNKPTCQASQKAHKPGNNRYSRGRKPTNGDPKERTGA